MEAFAEWGYVGLFLASFLAATVVPFSSELIFSAMVLGGKLDPWACVLVATAGNWLGSLTSYYVGYLGKIEWIEKYLRVSHDKIIKYSIRIQKYGEWMAFFSFVPFIGDVIAVATGFFKCRFVPTAVIMLVGKFVRYAGWMYFNGLFM